MRPRLQPGHHRVATSECQGDVRNCAREALGKFGIRELSPARGARCLLALGCLAMRTMANDDSGGQSGKRNRGWGKSSPGIARYVLHFGFPPKTLNSGSQEENHRKCQKYAKFS